MSEWPSICRAIAREIREIGDYPETWSDIPEQAAKEIERLQAENARLLDVYIEAKAMRAESGVFWALHEAIERVDKLEAMKND